MRTGIRLLLALQDLAAQRQPLPDQLPEPPRIPYEYLQKLGQTIEGEVTIGHADQAGILIQLRQGLRDEEDETVRKDIRKLLRDLRRRPEVTFQTVTEIDAILAPETSATKQSSTQPVKPAERPPQPAKAAGWYPDPSGNPRILRYWDGSRWTSHVTDQTGQVR
jgi:serine/threonine kinase PknH